MRDLLALTLVGALTFLSFGGPVDGGGAFLTAIASGCVVGLLSVRAMGQVARSRGIATAPPPTALDALSVAAFGAVLSMGVLLIGEDVTPVTLLNPLVLMTIGHGAWRQIRTERGDAASE